MKTYNTRPQAIDHSIYQIDNTLSIKSKPRKLMSIVCHIINDMLFIVMVTMGFEVHLELIKPIFSYVLINMFDDWIKRGTVSDILGVLNFFLHFVNSSKMVVFLPTSCYSNTCLSYTRSHLLFQHIVVQQLIFKQCIEWINRFDISKIRKNIIP